MYVGLSFVDAWKPWRETVDMTFYFFDKVTGVVGRAESLSSIFFIAALMFYAKCTGYHRQTGKYSGLLLLKLMMGLLKELGVRRGRVKDVVTKNGWFCFDSVTLDINSVLPWDCTWLAYILIAYLPHNQSADS